MTTRTTPPLCLLIFAPALVPAADPPAVRESIEWFDVNGLHGWVCTEEQYATAFR